MGPQTLLRSVIACPAAKTGKHFPAQREENFLPSCGFLCTPPLCALHFGPDVERQAPFCFTMQAQVTQLQVPCRIRDFAWTRAPACATPAQAGTPTPARLTPRSRPQIGLTLQNFLLSFYPRGRSFLRLLSTPASQVKINDQAPKRGSEEIRFLVQASFSTDREKRTSNNSKHGIHKVFRESSDWEPAIKSLQVIAYCGSCFVRC